MKPDYLKELLETVAKKVVQDFARELTENIRKISYDETSHFYYQNGVMNTKSEVIILINKLVKEQYGE